jgi:hypothetical protein
MALRKACALFVRLTLALAAFSLFAQAAGSQDPSEPIVRLQAQFRGLGGQVAFNRAAGADYRFSGRPAAPYEVADVLRAIREAHLLKFKESPSDTAQYVSAMSANSQARNLLQAERERHVSLLDASGRRLVNSALRGFYDAEIDLAWLGCRTACEDDAFRAAEFARARDFMGSLYRRGTLGARLEEHQALARFEALVAYRDAAAALTGRTSVDPGIAAAYGRVRRALDSRWSGADARGLARFDDPRSTDTGVSTASGMASRVPIGTVLIVYHITENGPYAFVLTRSRGVRFVRLPGTTAELRDRIRRYHLELSRGSGDRDLVGRGQVSPSRSWRGTGVQLFETLIAPLQESFGRADRLIIVPHDLLHLVPFAALPTSVAADASFLVDRYAITAMPSVMFAAWNQFRRREPTKGALVVGIDQFASAAPLRHAEAEARAIARVLPASDLLLGSQGQATFRRVMADVSRYEIIHIASHGAYFPGIPAASHVVLRSEDGQADEPLTAVDILRTSLNASVVVLSACETATASERGLPPDGDVLGLPRSFLAAGAGAVIASLWPVNDRSTRVLFEEVYRLSFERVGGDDKLVVPAMGIDEALAAAQRRIRAEYPDPHFWAPFILIGG